MLLDLLAVLGATMASSAMELKSAMATEHAFLPRGFSQCCCCCSDVCKVVPVLVWVVMPLVLKVREVVLVASRVSASVLQL